MKKCRQRTSVREVGFAGTVLVVNLKRTKENLAVNLIAKRGVTDIAEMLFQVQFPNWKPWMPSVLFN